MKAWRDLVCGIEMERVREALGCRAVEMRLMRAGDMIGKGVELTAEFKDGRFLTCVISQASLTFGNVPPTDQFISLMREQVNVLN